jgi:hypothetical protein
MATVGGGKAQGILENSVMVGNDRLKFGVYWGCLNCLNGMELGNDTRINLLA